MIFRTEEWIPALLAAILAAACGSSTPDLVGVDGGGTDTDTGTASPEVDCDNLPQGPFELIEVESAIASEDIAFDEAGNVVGSNDSAIFKTPYNGSPEIFVPNIHFRAGMRYLPTGDLVVANEQNGSLVRIDQDGVQHVVISGLAYPNGIAIDQEGMVYLSEHDAGRVRRIDPYSGDNTIVAQGLDNPNGLTFDPEYRYLYIDEFSGYDEEYGWGDNEAEIHRLEIDESGEPGELVVWATEVGSGWLDGMGVDACGNVYVCDYRCHDWDNTCIYRISPAGVVEAEPIIDPAQGVYMPNLQWGSGIGGWDLEHVYIPNGWLHNVYEINLGVPSKPRVYP